MKIRLALLAVLTFVLGCGTSSGPAILPDFTIAAAPTKLSLQSGGTPQALTVTVAGVDGSTQPVAVSLSALPAGVTAHVEGNSVVPRGILAWDGASWHTLATVCGGPATSACPVHITRSAHATRPKCTADLAPASGRSLPGVNGRASSCHGSPAGSGQADGRGRPARQ